MLRAFVAACVVALALPCHAACPSDSQLSSLRGKGVEFSKPLTVEQVEALLQTGPAVAEVPGIKPYGLENSGWQELKAKQRKGDYFIQFWRGRELVERTKFYMDGLYLIRGDCVIGWLKGAVS